MNKQLKFDAETKTIWFINVTDAEIKRLFKPEALKNYTVYKEFREI